MNFKKVAQIGLLIAAFPTSALAEHGGSPDDQLACTPDVYRLCASKIPDEDAIVACLERYKASLSPACKQVFSRPDPAPKHSDDDDD